MSSKPTWDIPTLSGKKEKERKTIYAHKTPKESRENQPFPALPLSPLPKAQSFPLKGPKPHPTLITHGPLGPARALSGDMLS